MIVPDAGPLITLAKSGLLPLLLLPRFPVYLVDQVVWEVTRDRRFSDARAIATFIERHGNQVHVFCTRVGLFCARERQEAEIIRQPGMGEAAIAEFVSRLDEVTGDALTPAFVLFEDHDVAGARFTPGPNTRRISTGAFLQSLWEGGLIPSFDEAWSAIERAGRATGAAGPKR